MSIKRRSISWYRCFVSNVCLSQEGPRSVCRCRRPAWQVCRGDWCVYDCVCVYNARCHTWTSSMLTSWSFQFSSSWPTNISWTCQLDTMLPRISTTSHAGRVSITVCIVIGTSSSVIVQTGADRQSHGPSAPVWTVTDNNVPWPVTSAYWQLAVVIILRHGQWSTWLCTDDEQWKETGDQQTWL